MTDREKELVNRYVYEVTKRIPKEQRNEIEMELRELIEDMAEGAPLEEVFVKLGDPAVFARKYRDCLLYTSIGLRTPELYPYTAKGILKIPQTFKKALKEYFVEMKEQGKIRRADPEELAMLFLSMNFGFVFLKASFGSELSPIESAAYIESSINTFVKGIL